MTFIRMALLSLLGLLVTACDQKKDSAGFQGWVEADLIFVSPDEPGHLREILLQADVPVAAEADVDADGRADTFMMATANDAIAPATTAAATTKPATTTTPARIWATSGPRRRNLRERWPSSTITSLPRPLPLHPSGPPRPARTCSKVSRPSKSPAAPWRPTASGSPRRSAIGAPAGRLLPASAEAAAMRRCPVKPRRGKRCRRSPPRPARGGGCRAGERPRSSR